MNDRSVIDFVRRLDSAVAEVRRDEKWRREYMVLNELLWDSKRLGENKRTVRLVRNSRHRFGRKELADIYYLTPKSVALILDTIDAHPDWDDEQIAESVDFE